MMAAIILALFSVSAQANAQRQVAAGFRISGVVVDAVTSVPVARAQVSISLEGEQTNTVAGDDGRFAFEGLAAGKYLLSATAPGYLHEGYKQHGQFFVGIATGKDQDTEHLIFRLDPEAVIYGRVTDDRGEAVRGAQVTLFASDPMRGSRERFVQSQAQTNDLGEYRLARLQPGKYYLAVQAHPWYAQSQLYSQTRQNSGFVGSGAGSSLASRIGPDPDAILDVVYPITFYPGVTDEQASAGLGLHAGDKQEANFILQAVPAAHLHIRVSPADVGTSFGIGATQRVFGTFTFGMNDVFGQVAPGEYEIAGLPPGELTLVLTTNKENEWTARSIEADTRSEGTIDASALPPTANVSGRILLPRGAGTIAGNVHLIRTEKTSLANPAAPLQKDGTFRLSEVQPGTYEVQVNLPSNDGYVQRISAKEAKVRGRAIIITAGSEVDLTVTLGQGRGHVTGTVQSEGKPASGVMILLVPESGLEMEQDSRLDESDSDGTFDLAGILPGEYVLLAIKDEWDLEWAKPDVLRPYLSAGQKISIAANQSIRVTVTAQDKGAAKKP